MHTCQRQDLESFQLQLGFAAILEQKNERKAATMSMVYRE